MGRKSTICSICENSNLASICPLCVNYRLNEYNTTLKSLKNVRDSLYLRLSTELVAKSKADELLNWRVLQSQKLAKLREKLHLAEKQLLQGKIKVESMSNDLNFRYGMLESIMLMLQKNREEQLEKFYPNLICTQSLGHMAITSEHLHKQSVVIRQICKLLPQHQMSFGGEEKDRSSSSYDQICHLRLPRGLDPHSVPPEELSASLGYMVLLLNLVIPALAAPALHNSGFAGSSSRIWQRNSYWDARPSSRSNEYPLFIPRQNGGSRRGENEWSEQSSSNFGVTSLESMKKPHLDASGSGSYIYTSASPHSVETHKDLQKGISLLKKSVACLTAYSYNSLGLDVPSNTTTFEALAKLLSMLSSSKEVRSVLSLKMKSSSSSKQVQQMNRSVWNVNSAGSSSTLLESAYLSSVVRKTCDDNLSNSAATFLYMNETTDMGKNDSLVEGWDIVEHPVIPPQLPQTEDIDRWAEAMFTDAKKR